MNLKVSVPVDSSAYYKCIEMLSSIQRSVLSETENNCRRINDSTGFFQMFHMKRKLLTRFWVQLKFKKRQDTWSLLDSRSIPVSRIYYETGFLFECSMYVWTEKQNLNKSKWDEVLHCSNNYSFKKCTCNRNIISLVWLVISFQKLHVKSLWKCGLCETENAHRHENERLR